MIVPSIDLMDGNAVQLIGGREKAIDAGDPRPIAESFGVVGEVAVIDLDAALGRGSNEDVIHELLQLAPCRVGGGIRSVETAVRWLDAGARKVILGTAATPEILRELPRDRVIAALDARDDRVVVEGWTKSTGARIEDRIEELRNHVCGFLVTFVEREGRMVGLPEERIRELAKLAAPCRLTVAGGVRAPEDIAVADRAGADTQVGMALYSGAFDLAEGFCAPLRSDRPDGLWPTVVTDEHGTALGLAYSDLESVRTAMETRRGVYHSRSRGGLWTKGDSSGDTQDLLAIDTDCDRDALRFTVRQHGGGFCHLGTRTCFGEDRGLRALEQTLRDRVANAPAGSYTRRLLDDPTLLGSKLAEEAGELFESATPEHAANEAADLLYFAMVAAVQRGTSLAEIERVLDDRSRKLTRRPGNAKPARAETTP
ncbi:MAG: phosphoribosyl-ATP diphosphatase [Planctomycetota bacterium]|nr:MAG: phosphoribosyl-ATP diphosphatase [Planctomycetota bacterium]